MLGFHNVAVGRINGVAAFRGFLMRKFLRAFCRGKKSSLLPSKRTRGGNETGLSASVETSTAVKAKICVTSGYQCLESL